MIASFVTGDKNAPIESLVPNANDLLALPVEELAGVLLAHFNSYGPNESDNVVQRGDINQDSFFLKRGDSLIGRALMEAWAWLQHEGFLTRNVAQPAAWFFISNRGKAVQSRDDLAAYGKANLLPTGRLHPLLANRVYSAFLRGDYDTAIFQAFKEVEISVRKAGGFPQELITDKLMRAAFAVAKNNFPAGPLTDDELPVTEQEAMAHLFAGAFGVYRNSTAHRHVPTEPEDAAEVIMFASQLLRIVDRIKSQRTDTKS